MTRYLAMSAQLPGKVVLTELTNLRHDVDHSRSFPPDIRKHVLCLSVQCRGAVRHCSGNTAGI